MNDDSLKALPLGWTWTILDEVADIERGITFPGSVKSESPGDGYIACLRTTNVQNEVNWDDLIYVPVEYVRNSAKFIYPNDILISMANSRELVGKTSYVGNRVVECSFGGFISVIRVAEPAIPKYIYYYFREFSVREWLKASSSQTVNIANLSVAKISQLEIPLPPLAEQQRIVEVIEAEFTRLDAGVAALKRLRANLKRYKAAVLKAAAEGKLVPQDSNDEPASELLKRILQERRAKWEEEQRAKGRDPRKLKYEEPKAPDTADLPELPEGWFWATLEMLSWDSGYGTSEKCDYDGSGPAVLRIPNVSNGVLNLDDMKWALRTNGWDEKEVLTTGDLLVIRTNGSKSLIGRSVLIESEFEQPHYFASYLIRFRCLQLENLPRWIAKIWDTPHIRQWIEQHLSNSAGQNNVNSTNLKRTVIPVPPVSYRRDALAAIDQILTTISKLEEALVSSEKRTERLRQSILRNAFAGRLVPQDPNDEPASELLKRIQQARPEHISGKRKAKR